jgi:hypothetical protein
MAIGKSTGIEGELGSPSSPFFFAIAFLEF